MQLPGSIEVPNYVMLAMHSPLFEAKLKEYFALVDEFDSTMIARLNQVHEAGDTLLSYLLQLLKSVKVALFMKTQLTSLKTIRISSAALASAHGILSTINTFNSLALYCKHTLRHLKLHGNTSQWISDWKFMTELNLEVKHNQIVIKLILKFIEFIAVWI
jgi:hypothetical protein